MALNDDLNKVLSDLRSAIPEIRGTLVASLDGMVISSNVSGGDTSRMAAMVATALSLGKKICDTFAGGDLNETSISGTAGQVFIYAAGPRSVLAAIVGAGSNIGLLHLESREKAKQIAQLIN
jgi:uncharacterized protein